MNQSDETAVTVLGLGEMGRALAATLLRSGRTTTVWNRSSGRAAALVAEGATEASSVHDAVTAGPVVIVCLRDYASARDLLDPEAETLSGRSIVNLTTGTPADARAMAAWASEHGVGYLDGGIMAVPAMIGGPNAMLLYSGSPGVFTAQREVLRLFGSDRFMGDDAGMASLVDLALLASMYSMFVGVYQATAMVGTAGMNATEFAEMVVPWLRAMTATLPGAAATIDGGDYTTDVQSLHFTKSAMDTIIAASKDEGVGTDVLAPIGSMIDAQIAGGYGDDVFTRIVESIRSR